MHRLALLILLSFQRPLDGAYPTHLLFQLSFGMAVRLKDRLGRFTQIMELAEPVWDPSQQLSECLANRLLAVAGHASDLHGPRFAYLTEQSGESFFRNAEHRAPHEYLFRYG